MSGIGEWDDVDVETGEVLEGPAEAPIDATGPELYFKSVDEFVREMIVPVFRRKVGDRSTMRWSAEWWRHPEAVLRLEALWRSWEHLRLDPATGLSVWLRDHADHHLSILFSDYGPFGKSQDSTDHGDPLPYEPPPPGLFPSERH
jgi:hypothetical protein